MSNDIEKAPKRISAFKELRIFITGYMHILMGRKRDLMISLMFPVLAAVIVIWIAGENMFVHYDGTKSGSFVIVSAAIWGGLFNSIQTIVKDRQNVKRYYMSGSRLRCYTGSRALVQFFLCAIQSAILSLSYIGVAVVYGNDLPEKGLITDYPMHGILHKYFTAYVCSRCNGNHDFMSGKKRSISKCTGTIYFDCTVNFFRNTI